jgi:hypothetical protein
LSKSFSQVFIIDLDAQVSEQKPHSLIIRLNYQDESIPLSPFFKRLSDALGSELGDVKDVALKSTQLEDVFLRLREMEEAAE